MINSVYNPHPALRDFVENITITSFDFTEEKNISPIYKFVPTHTRFLCFYLQDQVSVKKQNTDFAIRERAMIIGPQTIPVILDLGKKHKDVVVCLKPCGMYRLLGIPLKEIVDKDYDARLVIGKEVETLTYQLIDAETDEMKNKVIQTYLLKKLEYLKPCLPFDIAMLELVKENGNLNMDYVASKSCISLRQFERQSLERIGLPPKVYARLIRFSHAYKLKEMFPKSSWISIAHICGYFDQMHFIRDFKFFAGFTPSSLKEEDIIHSVRFRTLEDCFIEF